MGMDLGRGETFPLLLVKPETAETPAQLLKNRAGNKLVAPVKYWGPCGIKQGVLWGLPWLSPCTGDGDSFPAPAPGAKLSCPNQHSLAPWWVTRLCKGAVGQ